MFHSSMRGEHLVTVVDGDHRAFGQGVQVTVGDDGRHLDDDVAVRIQTGHFQIDPDQVLWVHGMILLLGSAAQFSLGGAVLDSTPFHPNMLCLTKRDHMAKRQLNRRQNWRIEKIQGERAARAAKRESAHGGQPSKAATWALNRLGLVIAHFGVQVEVEAQDGERGRPGIPLPPACQPASAGHR